MTTSQKTDYLRLLLHYLCFAVHSDSKIKIMQQEAQKHSKNKLKH